MSKNIKTLYKKHVNHLLEQIYDFNIKLVIHSGVFLMPKNVDLFIANSYFRYFCNHNFPNCFVVVENKKAILYILESDKNCVWHKNEVCESVLDVFEIRYYADVNTFLSEFNSTYSFICNFNCPMLNVFKKHKFDINDKKIITMLNNWRAVKSEYEVECITVALKQSFEGFVAIKKLLDTSQFVSERMLRNAYIGNIYHCNIMNPYSCIVCLNSNSSYLHHYIPEEENISISKYSMLIDAGVYYRGYCSDTTITLTNDPQFQELCDAVTEIRNTLISYAREGYTFEMVQNYTYKLVAETLVRLKVVNCTLEEAVHEDNISFVKYFFFHGFGHNLGLDVHDVNRVASEDSESTRNHGELVSGMVITVEPGIYFSKIKLEEFYNSDFVKKFGETVYNKKVIEHFQKYGGCRQEHNCVVGKHGSISLTSQVINRYNYPF